MSLTSVINNASSALRANQLALRTTSENISNANTPGYVRQQVVFGADVVDGRTAGVKVETIQRVTDRFFSSSGYSSIASAAGAERFNAAHEQLQAALGDPADGLSFAARTDAAFVAFAEAAGSPGSSGTRYAVLSDLNDLARSYSSFAGDIQNQRLSADQDIDFDVRRANALLSDIYKINTKIAGLDPNSGDANGLLQQQDTILGELSEITDIRVLRGSDGRAEVLSGSGLTLVNDAGYGQLNFDAARYSRPDTNFSPITYQMMNPQSGQLIGVAKDFGPNAREGELRSLLDLRDKELPGFAAQLGAAAQGVADALNAAHNNNVALPPPQTLEGRATGLIGTDALNFTGKTTLAITDAAGALQKRVDIDFDAGTLSVDGGAASPLGGGTLGDLVSGLNAALGGVGSVSLANGQLSVSASAATNGVAFLDDANTPSRRGGVGFSHFFGLNDLVSSGAPNFGATGLTSADAHGFTPGSQIEFSIVDAAGAQQTRTFTVPAGGTVGDLVSALNASGGPGDYFSFALDADGRLNTTPRANAQGATLHVNSDQTARAGSGASITDLFGLNGQRANAALDFSVAPEIAADSNRIGFARLDFTSGGAPGDIVLAAGDSRGALALQDAGDAQITFRADGGKTVTASPAHFASDLIGEFATRARAAEESKNSAAALRNEVETRRADKEGVNVDEELANLIVFQQSYNASARVITTANQLFDELLKLV